jgi:hypothetical protein
MPAKSAAVAAAGIAFSLQRSASHPNLTRAFGTNG